MSNAINLLLVEDSEDDARLAVRLLQRGGFEVQFERVDTAQGVEEALSRQSWDAVIADYRMPHFTGLDALKIVRVSGSDIPFILISGTVGEEIAVDAMKAGVNDFVIKTNLSRLASVLARELRESANRSEYRRAQDRMRGSESRYRRLFETARDGILLLNADTGQIEDVNPYLIEMLGYSHAEFLGKKLWEVGTFFDVPQSKEMFLRLQEEGYVRYDDLPLRTKAGARIPVEFVSNSYDCEGVIVVQCNIRDISERKRSEEALQRFVAAMDATADAIYLVDRASMRFIHVNNAACRMQSQSRDELLALGPAGVLSTSRAELERVYDAIIASGVDAEPLEMLRRRKDASEVWVELRRHALRSGDHWTIVTLVRDITERKRAAEELRRFRTAMDGSGDGIVLVDRTSMRYIDVNQTLCDMVGRTRQELLGMTPMDLFGVDREILERDYDAIIANKNDVAGKVQGQYRHKDGSLIPIETCRSALRTDDSWVIVGTARDITERKRAEQDLRQSERRFSDLLGNVEMVSIMLDTKSSITYCNDYMLRLTGWRREEIIGRDWFELFIPPGIEDLREVNAALLAGKPEALHHENEILTRSGERRLIRWNNSVLRSGAGEVIGTASIGEDITEQKRAGVRIKRLNRVYAVLSGINTLIVRARDRDELFMEACQIAVEHGEFKMAWIGVVDRSAMKVVPIASAGAEPEFLELVRDRFSLREDAPLGSTRTARAIREKKAIVVNKFEGDSPLFFAKERVDRGISSMAILPLLVSDEAVGVLALYAGEAGFFDEDEMRLLTELCGDIAFAIDHIGKQERLDYLAYYDALTGLANRTLFLERVTQHMRGAVSGGHKLALFFLDLERFRNINDSLGRPAGDALLKQVSKWLAHNVGDAGLLARIGADHFAIVLPQLTQPGDVARLLDKRIQAFLDHPFQVKDTELRLSVKVGVAVFPNDGTDADTLLKNAEAALKKAKKRGERYVFYKQKMTDRVAGKLSLENQLRQALAREEFVLHYQPKVNLESGLLTGAEALIRWNDPRTGLVPPGRFIPILEETGLIYDVGRWALRKAIEDGLRWRAAGLPAVRIAVNVSPLQLRNRGFVAEIEQAIGVDAQAPAGLELEITESLIMEDVKHSIATLEAIRAVGVTIAIDDFGTGFSSLSYLAKLPVDALKIDRSFVIDMTSGPQGLALVSTIISLAQSLKLKVVAEGVETEAQSRLLRLLSCDEMQGFLISKPLLAEIFEAKFLARQGQMNAPAM